MVQSDRLTGLVPHPSRRPERIGAGVEIRALTGLRAVAAAWVVAFHMRQTPGETWWAVLEPVHPLIRSGWLGVDLFFVLSGFVLTLSHLRHVGPRAGARTSAAFYWGRLSRVLPLSLLITVAFSGWLVVKHLLVGGPHVHEGVQPQLDPLHLAEQLLMVQMWHRPYYYGSSLVVPGWSLSAEWLAYLAFPLLGLLLYRVRHWPAAVLGAGALAAVLPFAYVAATAGTHVYAWSWLVRIAGCFLAGALTCLCVQRLGADERVRRWAGLVAGLAIAEVLVVVWWADSIGRDVTGAAVLLFPVLIGALALADRGPARLLSTPWLVMGGRISFALYLVHMCLFEVFWTAMDVVPWLGPGTPLAAFLLPMVLLVPIPVAYLMWRYVEEPSRRWMGRIGPAPAGRTDAGGPLRRPALPPVPAPAPVGAPPLAVRGQIPPRRHASADVAGG